MSEYDDIKFTKCQLCDHFVDWWEAGGPPDHLQDDDKEHDHEPTPGETRTLGEWKVVRPDLFEADQDGRIGPNRPSHVTRNQGT